MRRLAAELDAGTMSLYHYVRTKDELLTLVVDAVMGEVVLAARPTHARAIGGRRSPSSPSARAMRCAAIRGSSTSPTIPTSGPTRCATSTSRGRRSHRSTPSFEDKFDLITLVDEYVFGYCLHERNNLKDDPDDAEMVDYFGALLEQGRVPGAVRDGCRDGHAAAVVADQQPRPQRGPFRPQPRPHPGRLRGQPPPLTQRDR